MYKIASTILVLALAGGVAGCASESRKPVVQCKFPATAPPAPGTALVAQEYGVISAIPLDAVQFTDNLSKRVAVQYLAANRTPTNTVQVTARIVNCSDDSLVVGVRTNFMDQNLAPSEAQTIWQNVVLQPRALGQYQTSSTSRNVEHYVVELRNAGN